MFEIKILVRVSGALERLLKKIFVLRMRLLDDSCDVRWTRRVKSKDPKGLRRPVDLSGYSIPAETAGVAQSLRFGHVSLASPQCLFDFPTLAVLLLQGCYQRKRQNDKRNASNQEGQIGVIETHVSLSLINRAVNCKSRPAHRRVMHTGNGQPHDDGSNELLSKSRGSECQP